MERKNGWQLAEAMGDETPDATQRLLYRRNGMRMRPVIELQAFVIETVW